MTKPLGPGAAGDPDNPAVTEIDTPEAPPAPPVVVDPPVVIPVVTDPVVDGTEKTEATP